MKRRILLELPGQSAIAGDTDPGEGITHGDTDVGAGIKIGDYGPGGGIVFYDAGSQQSWGRYLEVAPGRWSGTKKDPKSVWRPAYLRESGKSLDTGVGFGSGRSNTALIVKKFGSDTAAGTAAGYLGNGLHDWFLPSKDELDALFQQRSVVGGPASGWFWSSSQFRANAYDAWSQSFRDGNQFDYSKDSVARVRPIRAF